MPTSHPLDILIQHNRWANERLLDACAALSDEQFHRRFEMGNGSLHDTLTHLIGAMRVWNDVLVGGEVRARIEGSRNTVSQLRAMHDEVAASLAAQSHARPLDELVTRVRNGQPYTFTRGGVLTHVTTHGMHHRAQCLNMLRHVGVATLPQSSVLEWMLYADPKK